MKAIACCLLLALSAAARESYPVDWSQLEPEILEYFTTLLKIDTSNPPGNETNAAQAIRAILERGGVSSQLFALEPARANLVARIKGNGSKRPILLMGHTDVVGAQRERWTVDPFAAISKNGFIFGRGAVDDKDHAVADLMTMLLLQRLHVKLNRDVIFLAEAGEEGTPRVGIDYMIREHWPEIDAEYALAEGGSIAEENGKVHHVLIATTEKVPRGVRLVATGVAGHGSRPIMQNAVVHLASAVARAGTWQTPMRLNAATRTYFERLAAISPPALAARYRQILDPARAAQADQWFREHEPGHYSIVRTSVVPTILKAGFRSNVIPSEAEAYLDVRALPDEDMPRFLAELKRVIGDPSVAASFAQAEGRPASPPSRIDTDLFHALEAVGRRMFNAPTLPGMLTGATDNAQLRARGVQAYGFGPIIASSDPLGGAHSDDERIATQSLMKMVEYLWNTVLEVGTN
ncbi:MAG: M20/M25/M40 family metallo-hydrolase [Acidobacteriia bacterium]|nr:M20/M25/M40 family metallo-hydrolase [Terriglobia bacterium]